MWKKIKDFEKYEISLDGKVRVIYKNGKIKYLKPWINSKNPNDYFRISLSKDNKQYKFLLHRLVALNFIKNKDNKPQVNHRDGNRQNNFIENLEWVTNSENQIHSFKVTKTWKHNNSMKGKFGKDHNCSKPFIIEFSDGIKKEYGSEYELVRDIGYGKTSISWARKNKKSGYRFTQGKMKGLIVHFEIIV